MIFLAAVYLGRLTRISGTSVNLLWPAAGVAVVWFSLHRRSPVPWLDWVALAVVTTSVDVATGASLRLAGSFAVANLVQTLITIRLFVRWSPGLWLNGGAQTFARVAQFWHLAAAAVAGSVAGAAIGPAAVWLFGGGTWSWLLVAVWLARNTAGIVLAGVVALQLESAWSSRSFSTRSPKRPPWVGRWAAAKQSIGRRIGSHTVEGLALGLATGAAFAAVVALSPQVPIEVVLLSLTVWAGLRFSTTVVALFSLVVSAGAVILTLRGEGPFSAIESGAGQALATQFLVATICVAGLCLSLGRRERADLVECVREAEQDARSQADVFATIVETMGAGLVVVGADGQPMLGNRAAQRLTAPSRSVPLLGHAPGTPPPLIDELPYREALAGHVIDAADVVVPGEPGGESRILNVSAAPLPARVGGGAVLVFSDVTGDRHQREDLAGFAGVVAHDLLTPLTAMSGWADLLSSLLSRAAPDPMVDMATESLTWIQDAATRASTMVGELLSYTTAGDAPIAPRDVDLAEMVTELVAERTRGRNDPLDDEPSPLAPEFEISHLEHVAADPVLIRQLLANLIDNALKYVAPESVPQISIGAAESGGGWVQICVADHGIGIPAGQHEAIFENFHRAHRDSGYDGSGIGLAICRRIVERHGGGIRAEDNDGGGTRFVVTLPAVTPEDVAGGSPGRDAEAEERAPATNQLVNQTSAS